MPFEFRGLGGTWRHTAEGKEQLPVRHEVKPESVASPSRMIAMGDTVLRGPPSGTPEMRGRTFGSPFLEEALSSSAVQQELGVVVSSLASELNASSCAAMRSRHQARWNVAFCDGHVERLKPRQFLRQTDPSQNAMWNFDHTFRP